jgi:hypothetical protein
MRKRTLVKLAGGAALAVTGVLVSAGGASASSGYNNHYGSGYNQNNYHKQSHAQNYNKHYDNSYKHQNNYKKYDNNSYGRGSGHTTVVYKVVYAQPSGFWYGGKWYNYSQVGYWDCGRWVSYHSGWSEHDWHKWKVSLYH